MLKDNYVYTLLECEKSLKCPKINNVKLLKTIGKRIRIRRKQMQISQEKFAELCNLHRNYFGAVERGEKQVTLEKLEIILRVLNVSFEKFFEGI